MNVLVPIDFTEVSMNSLSYAYSRFHDASLTVLHAIPGLIDFERPNQSKSSTTRQEGTLQELSTAIMEELEVDSLPQNIKIETNFGEPVAVITRYLNDHAFDAVVMGSRDKYDLVDKIFGTVTLGVIKRNEEPVFVIPRYADFKHVHKIMVATDFHMENPNIVRSITQWNPDNAHVKFLHITENKDEDFEATKQSIIAQLYESEQPSYPYEIEAIYSDQVSSSLLAKTYNFGADLLIIISRPSSFLKELLIKSTTKEILFKSSIPMLFLNYRKNNTK